MGDYRTVAAVSRAIAHVLEGALDRRGMRGEYKVTIASPHHASASRDHNSKSINLFLYHVRPTPSLRNTDLPVYEGGRLVHVPTVGLDLFYLLSFYGTKPNDLEAERLLGLAVTTLNAHPLLTQTDFDASADPGRSDVGQLDTVAVTPMTLTIEEMQRLWTMFPNVPYTLSMSYCASAALLVGDEIPAPPLPVSAAARHVAPKPPPQVSGLARADAGAGPISFKSALRVSGQHLSGSRVAVAVGAVRLPVKPANLRDSELEVELEDPALRAGPTELSVLQLDGDGSVDEARVLASSVPVAFELLPILAGVSASSVELQGDGSAPPPHKYRGRLELGAEPLPKPGQRARVFLNRLGLEAYGFAAQVERGKLSVVFEGVPSGRYLVRVEIDGVSSLLEPQGGQPYTSPSVQIVPRRSRHG
jgi:hypothetical protein